MQKTSTHLSRMHFMRSIKRKWIGGQLLIITFPPFNMMYVALSKFAFLMQKIEAERKNQLLTLFYMKIH